MLQQSRNLAKSKIFKLVIYVLIAAFALSGASAGFMMDFSDNYIVKVGGEKIYPHEVKRRYDLIARNLVQEGINFSEEQLSAMGVSQQEVLNSMIREKLLRHELKSLSLSVGDEEIARQIKSASRFNQDGVFNREEFQIFLYQRGMREDDYVNVLRSEISTNMLMSMILTGNPLIDSVKETALEKASEARIFQTVSIAGDSKKLTAKVTDKDLEEFYFESSFMFEVPEQRKVEYIEFINVPGQEAETFGTIDKIEDGVGGGSTLQELANELGLELQKAEKVSVDASAFSEKFLQAVMLADEGETSGVIEDEDGDKYFVVTLVEVQESYIPELAEVKAEVTAQYKAQQSMELTREFANKLYKEAKEKSNLAAVARKYGFKATKTSPLKRDDYDKVEYEMLQDGFAAESGDVIGVYYNADGGYEVAALAGVKREELTATDKLKESERLSKELEAEILAQYLSYLETKYPVKQNPSYEAAVN